MNTRYVAVDVYNASGTTEKAVTDIQAVQGTAYARIAGAEGTYLTRLVNLPVKDASVGNMCDLYPTTFKTMTSVPDQLDLGERTSLEKFFSATPKDVHYTEDGYDGYIQDGDGGCRALLAAPMMDTSGITNMSMMFGYANIEKIRKEDIYGNTEYKNFTYINACVNMVSVPRYDASNVTNFSGMFANCSSLVTIPSLNTSSGTNFAYMFQNCTSLPAVFPWTINLSGAADVHATTSFEKMFEGSSVEEVTFSYDPVMYDDYGNEVHLTPELLDTTGTLRTVRCADEWSAETWEPIHFAVRTRM